MAKQPSQKALTKKHVARLERERIQRRNLLIGAGSVFALVLGLIIFGLLDEFVFQNMRPVARVDNEAITTGEFQKEVRFDRFQSIQQLISVTSDPMMLQFFGSFAQQTLARLNSPITLGQEVLDRMIEDILIAREAEQRGITLSQEELDKEFEQAFGFYEDGTPTPTNTATPLSFSTSTLSPTQLALVPSTPTPIPTEVVEETATPEVTDTPEATATPADTAEATPEASPTITQTPTITPTPTAFTRELFENEVTIYLENTRNLEFSRADLRNFIRRQVLRNKVYEALTADLETTGEFVWARHILVPTEEEAQQVLDRLEAGEAFSDLARELSTDESNKDFGGDLGWFTRGRMVAEFEEAAFSLAEGEISQPVLSDFGFHIIQVLGREKRPLEAQEMEQAKQEAFTTWLNEAREAANVEMDDHWISVVPGEPEVPADIQAIIQQQMQPQSQ